MAKPLKLISVLPLLAVVQCSAENTTSPAPLSRPTTTHYVEGTNASGVATFSDANVTVTVLDATTDEPLTGIQVTLLTADSDYGVVVVDPAGRYGAALLDFSVPTASSFPMQSTSKDLELSVSPLQFDVPFSSVSTIEADLLKYLLDTFFDCSTETSLADVEDILSETLLKSARAGVGHFVTKPWTALLSPTLQSVVALITVSEMARNNLAALWDTFMLKVYVDAGYSTADRVTICLVTNPDARTFLDNFSVIYPLEGPSNAPAQLATLTGTVVDARSLVPLGGAAIELVGPTQRRGRSIPGGAFAFQRLTGGSYRLNVAKPGYNFVTMQLEVAGGASVDQEVRLVPLDESQGEQLALSRSKDGNREIYLIDLDSQEAINLSKTSSFERWPTWSPDGAEILFFSTREDGLPNFWRMNADGSNVRRVTLGNVQKREPRWSPGGTEVAYTHGHEQRIHLLNLSTGASWQVCCSEGLAEDPAWSPDGLGLAFSSTQDGNWDIFTLDLQPVGNLTNLTGHGDADLDPDWSPDGSTLLFVSDRDGDFDVYRLVLSDLSVHRITNLPGGERQPRWSPDGSKIVFTNNNTGQHEVYLLHLSSGELVRISDGTDDDIDPAWRR